MKKRLLGLVRGALEKVERSLDPQDPPRVQARATAPLRGSGAQTTPLKTPEEAAADSRKRLALILAFAKDPTGHPAFQDKALVYRVLQEERAYQQAQFNRLSAELQRLPQSSSDLMPQDEATSRSGLVEALQKVKSRQSHLFTLMKNLTGVQGRTGGTGFLVPPTDQPTTLPGADFDFPAGLDFGTPAAEFEFPDP